MTETIQRNPGESVRDFTWRAEARRKTLELSNNCSVKKVKFPPKFLNTPTENCKYIIYVLKSYRK